MTGIQTMLQGINPCAAGYAGCTSSSANANFRVSLFGFPNVPVTQVADDYNCGGTPIAAVIPCPPFLPRGQRLPTRHSHTQALRRTTATYQILQHSATRRI